MKEKIYVVKLDVDYVHLSFKFCDKSRLEALDFMETLSEHLDKDAERNVKVWLTIDEEKAKTKTIDAEKATIKNENNTIIIDLDQSK